MASTFFSYKDRHVHVPESPVVIVSYMLFHEAWLNAGTPEEKARYRQMTDDFQRRTVGVGCTDLGLDQLLQGDPKKEAEFLGLVSLVRVRLHDFGTELPVDYVNQVLSAHIPEWKDRPLSSPWFNKVLDLIEALIQGTRLPPSNWLTHFRKGVYPKSRLRRKHKET